MLPNVCGEYVFAFWFFAKSIQVTCHIHKQYKITCASFI